MTSGLLQVFTSFLPLVFLPWVIFHQLPERFVLFCFVLINAILMNSPPAFKIISLLPCILGLESECLSMAHKHSAISNLPTIVCTSHILDSCVANTSCFLLFLGLHKCWFLHMEQTLYRRTSNMSGLKSTSRLSFVLLLNQN